MTKTILIRPQPGDNIDETCIAAVEKAQSNDCAVCFNFNGHSLTAFPSTSPDDLKKQYREACEKAAALYRASDEYKAAVTKYEEEERSRAKALEDALSTAPEKMTLSDLDGWRKACDANTDPYGAAALRYAEVWARVMESEIAKGGKVEDIEDRCSHIADSEGVTGFMHNCAKATLRKVWLFGTGLRAS